MQVDLKTTDDVSPLIVGSVRGNEQDAALVKEATLCVLQAYCDTLAVSSEVHKVAFFTGFLLTSEDLIAFSSCKI